VPKSVAPGFRKKGSFRLAAKTSELNAMDQLWKELKGDRAANRQFKNIAEAVEYAEHWVLHLTDDQA
jgi:hypothetical protein